jgi:hypothetical protein
MIVFDKLYNLLISQLIDNFWLTMIETKMKFSENVFQNDENSRIDEICKCISMINWIILDDIEIEMLF